MAPLHSRLRLVAASAATEQPDPLSTYSSSYGFRRRTSNLLKWFRSRLSFVVVYRISPISNDRTALPGQRQGSARSNHVENSPDVVKVVVVVDDIVFDAISVGRCRRAVGVVISVVAAAAASFGLVRLDDVRVAGAKDPVNFFQRRIRRHVLACTHARS